MPKSKITRSEADIALRAYQIWEAEGKPDGKDFEHWLKAETEVVAPKKAPARKPAAAPKAKTAAKAKTASKTKTAAKPKTASRTRATAKAKA